MIQTNKIYWADKLGAISAFLCIIHCLAVPTLLSMGMGFLKNPIVTILFVIVAFISIFKTTNKTTSKGTKLFLWFSFAGFVTSIFLEESAPIFEYLMFLFSGFIIAGHIYNARHCLKAKK